MNTIRIKVSQIVTLIRRLAGQTFDATNVGVAIAELFSSEPIAMLGHDELQEIAGAINALDAGNILSAPAHLSPEELEAVNEAWSIIYELENNAPTPPNPPTPQNPPPPAPPANPVVIDGFFALLLAHSFEFAPASPHGFRSLAGNVPAIASLLAEPDSDTKVLEIGVAIEMAKVGAAAPAPARLSQPEQDELVRAVQSVRSQSGTKRFTPLFERRLRHLVVVRTRPNEMAQALRLDCGDPASLAIVNTGSFSGLTTAIASIQKGGKDLVEAIDYQLRQCELDWLVATFSKKAPAQVSFVLTADVVREFCACAERATKPDESEELEKVPKAFRAKYWAVVQCFARKGECAVKPASFYGITDPDYVLIMDTCRARFPVANNPVTRDLFLRLYTAIANGEVGEHWPAGLGDGIDPVTLKAAKFMIADYLKNAHVVKREVGYGLANDPATYQRYLGWLKDISDGGEHLGAPLVPIAPGKLAFMGRKSPLGFVPWPWIVGIALAALAFWIVRHL